MQENSLVKELIKSLTCLPGVGPKSAQRMAFHLLERDRQGGQYLSQVLQQAMTEIQHCENCRTLTEQSLCQICQNPGRDESLLCVVESPADVWFIEQATAFKGYYFVLHGHLSPIDGIGPDDLGFELLEQKLADERLREVILATNSTVEGEATAHLISDMARKHHTKASRIAHGVPMGGELEYIDSNTLMHAFDGRREIA